MWVFIWVFRLFDWVNSLAQMWHLYGLSCVWTFRCSAKSLNWIKTLLQMEHNKGFSSLWILIWLARSMGFINWTQHSVHCSPVWVRMWVVKLFFWLNRLSQKVHLNGFSPISEEIEMLKISNYSLIFVAYIWSIWSSYQCVFACAFSNYLIDWNPSHIHYICMVFHLFHGKGVIIS